MWTAIKFVAGWFWLWEVVAAGATAVFIAGGIGAIYGDDFTLATSLFFVAIVWVTAKAVSWSEVTNHQERVWVSIVIILLAVLCFWGSMTWIQKRAEEAKKDQPLQQQPASLPSGNALPPSQKTQSDPKQEPPKAVLEAAVPALGRPKGAPKIISRVANGGSDNTTYGNVAPPTGGSRNTFVGPTDAHGNTFIPAGIAVGANARADPTSVAIGSGAGSQAARKQQFCETGSLCNQDSQVNAPQTVNNFARPARRLDEIQKSALVACLAKHTGSIEIGAVANSPEAYAFANDWMDVFKASGWSIKENLIHVFMIGGGVWSGTQIDLRGSVDPDGKNAKYDSDSAEGLMSCLLNRPFPGGASAIPRKDMPVIDARLFVGPSAVH